MDNCYTTPVDLMNYIMNAPWFIQNAIYRDVGPATQYMHSRLFPHPMTEWTFRCALVDAFKLDWIEAANALLTHAIPYDTFRIEIQLARSDEMRELIRYYIGRNDYRDIILCDDDSKAISNFRTALIYYPPHILDFAIEIFRTLFDKHVPNGDFSHLDDDTRNKIVEIAKKLNQVDILDADGADDSIEGVTSHSLWHIKHTGNVSALDRLRNRHTLDDDQVNEVLHCAIRNRHEPLIQYFQQHYPNTCCFEYFRQFENVEAFRRVMQGRLVWDCTCNRKLYELALDHGDLDLVKYAINNGEWYNDGFVDTGILAKIGRFNLANSLLQNDEALLHNDEMDDNQATRQPHNQPFRDWAKKMQDALRYDVQGVMESAAEQGNYELFVWLREKHPDVQPATCDIESAASNGHFFIVNHYASQTTGDLTNCVYKALQSKHMFLAEHLFLMGRVKLNVEMLRTFSNDGHHESVIWIYENLDNEQKSDPEIKEMYTKSLQIRNNAFASLSRSRITE